MTLAPQFIDAGVRDRIANDLDTTLVVEAAAGTGKTTELVRRIIHVLKSGRADVTQIVAVTFTEKAAGELKLRLRQELETAGLEHALKNLEEAHISTIHGFCAELLRERPVEAGIDPLFTVLTEPQARRLYDEAFNDWFQEALEQAPEGVRRSLRRTSRFGGGEDDDGPVERLRRAGWDLAEWRDFPAPWTRPPFNRLGAAEALAQAVHDFAHTSAQAASSRDVLFTGTAAARRASEDLRLLLDAGDADGAEAALVDLSRDYGFRRIRKSGPAAYARGLSRADVCAAHDALMEQLDAFRVNADADLAALLRDELQGSIVRYETSKARQGALDFLDLLLKATALVRERDEVRQEFQQRFKRIFVDEFQDTDPLQAELLLLLSADDPSERQWRHVCALPGKLFIVGDPKQSIYRFRRADVRIYRDVCEQLSARGASCVQLTTSFRGLPNIQRVVNAAFSRVMTGDRDTLQADYVPLAAARRPETDQPSVVALPVPEPYGRWKVTGKQIEQSLPDAVGAFIHWLMAESGWRVTERRSGGGRVPIEARHICILFRRFVNFGADVTRPYVDALEARGLKHLLVGGRAFHEREEIETLRAALTAIEWPDDELSVFATLRGALFAIGDEELLEYRHSYARAFHPFRIPDVLPTHLEPVADALRLLAELHRARNHRPVADTIARLLEATRAYVGFALRRAGEQVLANTLHVAELARQYELSGGISFRGFVEELRDAASTGQAAEAPIVEEGSDGVRLMTVHKAKGLEFPVVILADMTAKLAPNEASRHLDPARGLCALRIGGWSPRELLLQQPLEQAREQQEGIRVAYVAATRARDLLVVPAVGDEPFEGGWTSPLDAAVYPPVAQRRTPEPVPGAPPFRKDSVLQRPDNEVASSATVAPGLHRVQPGNPDEAFEIAWWDPAALSLGAEPPFGLRRQELISRDVAPEVVAAGEARYVEWRNARTGAVAAGRSPSLSVRTTTEWAADTHDAPPPAVEIIVLDAAPGRPAGRRYGTLVHAALSTVPLDADAAAIDTIVATQGRIVGATSDEVASAATLVATALAHPLFAAARAAEHAGRCLREMPVTATVDGVVIEGVVDFAFDSGDGYVVIDFKTDRAEGEALDRYARQVQFYADAIAKATARPARAVLMQV
ncbi:MAG: UvrD-helicase domain-containing protein [Vicinamibacterales bacterium]